ncbi:hypothetical protein C1N60_11960 [Pantoea sp. SGAir0184]
MTDNTLLVQCLFNKIVPVGKLTPLQTVLIKLDEDSFRINYDEMKKMMVRISMTADNQKVIKKVVEKEWKRIKKAKSN